MNSSQMMIMFIFSGICFVGGFLIGYSVWGTNEEKKNQENEKDLNTVDNRLNS